MATIRDKLALELARADLAALDRDLREGEKVMELLRRKQAAKRDERAELVAQIERLLNPAE